ncbi:MAG: hypothetical protein E6772_11780 [Dysgonomonas sp.]|nr:hypothetical protein [Dysgonomonas sp.]
MKKGCLVILLVCISLFTYSQDKWLDIAVTENEEIYIDTTDIKTKDGLIYVTIKTVYTTSEARQYYVDKIKKAFPKKAEEKIKKWNNFNYNISQRIYDCENKQYQTLQVTDHRTDGSSIVKTKVDKKKRTWIPVDIDTVADHVLFYICDRETR